MSMDMWIQVMEKFGWPAIMVGALLFFWYSKVWPFLVQQLTYNQKLQAESQAGFMLALERRDLALERQAEVLREQNEILATMQGEISATMRLFQQHVQKTA